MGSAPPAREYAVAYVLRPLRASTLRLAQGRQARHDVCKRPWLRYHGSLRRPELVEGRTSLAQNSRSRSGQRSGVTGWEKGALTMSDSHGAR
jgi:hypothetical protein